MTSWETISVELAIAERQVQKLREQMAEDTKTLESLDPDSVAYARLQARLDQKTHDLLDCEERIDTLRGDIQRVKAKDHRESMETRALFGGLAAIFIGALITYAAWGTWWLVPSILMILFGLISVVNHKTMWD